MNTFLYNPLLILIMMCLYICIVTYYKPAYLKQKNFSNPKNLFGVFLIFIFSLYAVQDTDYFHYIDALEDLSRGGFSHFEDIYIDIASYVDYQNIHFRMIVWGAALVLFVLSIKRLGISLPLVLFFFAALFIMKFSYARASLAMAFGVFGYTFLAKPIRFRLLSFTIGVLLISASLLFHKSASFWILIFLCSIIQLKKPRLGILLLLYPVGVYFSTRYGLDYFLASVSDDFAENAMGYMSKDALDHGLNYYVRMILTRTPYYLMFLGIIISVFKGNYQQLPSHEKKIINISFYIIYFSSFFLFDFGVNTSVMYYRFLYYSIMPLSMLMAIFYKSGINLKLLKYSVILGVSGCIFDFLYSYYNATL